MAFNGSGTFVRLKNWTLNAAQNINILPDLMDADANDIAAGLSQCITRDGQSVPTANIGLNGFRLTGVADPVALQDAATLNWVATWTAGTYAPLAAPVFTGIPTAPTAAPGTNTGQIATMAALLAQAMNANLPAQAGSSGKGVGTNGAVGRWESFGIKLAPITGGALTDANCFYSFVVAGSYTLPDFTGSSTFGLASLSNSAAVPATVQTSDGWTLAPGLTAGTFKAVAPMSTATPHGTWGSLAMTPPILGTITAAAAPTIQGTVLLAPGLLVLLYGAGTFLYAVAVNTVTGAFGVPVVLGGWGSISLWADTATTFVVGSGGYVIAGTVTGTTITLGPQVVLTYPSYTIIQLTAGSYLACGLGNQAGNGQVIAVGGNVVSAGINTSSGFLISAGAHVVRHSNTQVLLVGNANGGPQPLSACILTVAGSTFTAGAVAVSADANNAALNGAIRLLKAFAPGGPYLACVADNTTATTGNYFALTVAAGVVTIGGVFSIASNIPVETWPSAYQYMPGNNASARSMAYSATAMVLGHLTTGPFVMSVAGVVLTAGAVLPITGATIFTNDVSTGLNLYAVSAAAVNKITVAGTTITSSYQLAGTAVIISSDTLNSAAVNYSGTWYAWALPAMAAAITANKWLSISGNNLNIYGPIA